MSHVSEGGGQLPCSCKRCKEDEASKWTRQFVRWIPTVVSLIHLLREWLRGGNCIK
jgi:hypothetical protein